MQYLYTDIQLFVMYKYIIEYSLSTVQYIEYSTCAVCKHEFYKKQYNLSNAKFQLN